METQRGFIHKPIKLVGPNNFENILKPNHQLYDMPRCLVTKTYIRKNTKCKIIKLA